MALELYFVQTEGTYCWNSPRTIQKSNKRRYEALSSTGKANIRELGYNNRGKKNIRASHDLLNKHYPEVPEVDQKCKVKLTSEDGKALWVEFNKGNFWYWESKSFGGVFSSSIANEIAEQVKRVNPNIEVEVVPA